MKVFVEVIEVKNGVYQQGMIDEPIKKGLEIANALGHFGINVNTVNWISTDASENWKSEFGIVEGTSKIVNVISLINL